MSKILKNTRYVRITEDTCRICLRETPLGKKVLKSFKETIHDLPKPKTLGKIYEACTGYRAKTGPQNVCSICEESLKQFYLFRMEVDNSEDVLKFLDEEVTVENEKVQNTETNDDDDDDEEELGTFTVKEEPFLQNDTEFCEVNFKEDNDYLNDDSSEAEGMDSDELSPSKKKSVECPYCPKTFPSEKHCEQHKKTHLKTQDYQCKICRKWFNKLTQLNLHKLSHTDVRSYECKLCHKMFKTKRTLKGHEETHSTVIQYFCTYCDAGYSNKTALRVHTIRKHWDETATKK